MFDIIRLIWSSVRNTDNICRSIVGYGVIRQMKIETQSELHYSHWSLSHIVQMLLSVFWVRLPFRCPTWMPFPLNTLFGGNSQYLPATHLDQLNEGCQERLECDERVRHVPDIQELGDDGVCMIFVNGILSNRTVVEMNRKTLQNMFHRPVNVLHNATDSIVSDLFECAVGKFHSDLTEASSVALHVVCNKLLDPKIKKLVVLCHSQGTIVVANVMRHLHVLGLDKLEFMEQMEVFTFACCASNMKYVHPKQKLPYMEHFANTNDIVARLGSNCAQDVRELISIDGTLFLANRSGHLFNAHYMDGFKKYFPRSRLLKYMRSHEVLTDKDL